MESPKTISLLITLNLILTPMLMAMGTTPRYSYSICTNKQSDQTRAHNKTLALATKNNNLEGMKSTILKNPKHIRLYESTSLYPVPYRFTSPINGYLYSVLEITALDEVQSVEAVKIFACAGMDINYPFHEIFINHTESTKGRVATTELSALKENGFDVEVQKMPYKITALELARLEGRQNTVNAITEYNLKHKASISNKQQELMNLHEFGKRLPPAPKF